MSEENRATNTRSYLEEIDWDPDTEDFRVTLIFNDAQFIVCLSREILPGYDETGTIEGKWLDDLHAVRDDDEKEPALIKAIAHNIEALCLPIMRETAHPPANAKISLYMCLNPTTLAFQVRTVKGKATLVQCAQPVEIIAPPQATLQITAEMDLPIISSTDIEVVKKLYARRVFKVLVNGREGCCKIAGDFFHDSIQREFDALCKIVKANVHQIRVPRLTGVVKNSDGNLIGILTEYIETAAHSLAQIDLRSISKSQKQKWALQIQNTVQKLHEIGIVWGDVKTDNVLIDRNEDAWIVDFGGGRTHGWIDQSLSGTPEGDLDGVKRIINVLEA